MKRIFAASMLALAALSASVPAFALGDLRQALREAREHRQARTRVSAPEIDITVGTKGIAALIAGLLLAAEALRRRR